MTQMSKLSKTEFEIIEGRFHDGLGTYAELILGNEFISFAKLEQHSFDIFPSKAKMANAISSLPLSHPSRTVFQKEITNIEGAAKQVVVGLLDKAEPFKLTQVRHTARDYADAKAADLVLQFNGRSAIPISVKTDKSNKVAVAEGQTSQIGTKWAERYFKVSAGELDQMIKELGFSSMAELKSHYINVSRLVANVIIRKLGLVGCKLTDFSKARVTDLEAMKYLFRQLLYFKKGGDGSLIIIFNRSTGKVKWGALLDNIDIENLTLDRVSFQPSCPRDNKPIGSTFGIKIDGKTVVDFQIKHRRGSARGTARQHEFLDITTRLKT